MLSPRRIEHLTKKIIQSFWDDPSITEIYSDNSVMKIKIQNIFNKYCNIDQKLDSEIRKKLKNNG